ncbi:nuclear transport factor 2 family protein [Pseudomonas sp. v388]|uniref:nuclear transport factor 2 family protein n=1 Tax=Pseudomonas sp. v388 TaxID=2479849 RepID=UPI000F793DC2|nr:nuclear transport factor 2 family protein [Pseudomonas sp. v388]RRV10461.1 nuclear transport factor 2 family protein [Pseudomonas sp. v388]
MVSLVELQDHIEVEQVVKRVAYAIDHLDWKLWEDLFAHDAELDFSNLSGNRGSPEFFQERITNNSKTRIGCQHLTNNIIVTLAGETATTHSEFSIFNVKRSAQPGQLLLESMHGQYKDTLVKTGEGWRIQRREGYLTWKESREVSEEHVKFR